MRRISPGVASADISENAEELARDFAEAGVRYVHLNHEGARSLSGRSLIGSGLARSDVRQWLVSLASAGYYTYKSNDGSSRLCHEDRLRSLWQAYTKGLLDISSAGVFYSLAGPEITEKPDYVYVILSAMGNDMFTQSLNRFYVQNYQHIGSAVGRNNWVLRVADVGGVLGSFYLPTSFNPENANRIQALLSSVADRAGVERRKVVIVGSSKGATGAAYHALHLGSSMIAVDPILEDTYYEERQNDCHFTRGGIFLESKEHVFEKFDDSFGRDGTVRLAITSRNSPQFNPVSFFFERLRIPVLICNDKAIKDHPDVAKVTHRIVMSIATSIMAGLPLPNQSQIVR